MDQIDWGWGDTTPPADPYQHLFDVIEDAARNLKIPTERAPFLPWRFRDLRVFPLAGRRGFRAVAEWRRCKGFVRRQIAAEGLTREEALGHFLNKIESGFRGWSE